MPLYEYRCASCGERFELLRSLAHADDVVCHRCHSRDVKRLLSVFAVHAGATSRAGASTGEGVSSSGGGCCGGSCGCCGH
jgi:putative FmdB family regulatory protein